MEKETKHLYSEAAEFDKPVVERPFSKSVFVSLIREGVEVLFNRTNVIRNNHRMYANILEHYLNKYEILEIVPDEDFFNTMWDRLMEGSLLNGRTYNLTARKKVPRTARRIVNEYLLPKGLVLRKVLKKMIIQRYKKFFDLTKNSQDAIVWFEQHGKLVRAVSVLVESKDGTLNNDSIKTIHRLTNKNLLPMTKSGKIDHALRLLRIVNKNGFEFVDEEDVKKLEDYCAERNVIQKEDYLAHVATFFINIQSQGFIKHNPFGTVSLKMNGGVVRKDFISPKDMEKFRDLSTLDFKNKIAVRDRLFVLLAYDLALRLNELLALELSDIRKDPEGDWHVILKSGIQKGQNKDEEIMYFFFEETKKLLERYIQQLRRQFKPVTNHLIVSNQGGSLGSQHCRKRFVDMCKAMGIQTFYGNSPSPHVLRHSFATINIEPLGLSLPLYEMAQRLRHIRVETTRKHYIHNNPFLQKLKHSVYRDKGNKKTTRDVLDQIPLADLEHWLSDKLTLDSATIRAVRNNYKKVFGLNVSVSKSVDKNGEENTIYISEEEALQTIKHLEISYRSLRQYAFEKNVLASGYEGTFRHGKSFRYKKDFIDDLARNWISVQSLQSKLKLSPRSFQYNVRNGKWRTKQIGRHRFIHREDCL